MPYSKEYYQNHKQAYREANYKWRAKNPDKNREYTRKYVDQHREKINENRIIYYHKNAELLKQKSKQYYDKHKNEENYKCEACQYTCAKKQRMDKHLETKLHFRRVWAQLEQQEQELNQQIQ